MSNSKIHLWSSLLTCCHSLLLSAPVRLYHISLWAIYPKFLRPLSEHSLTCVLRTYTRAEQIDYVTLPYLVSPLPWNDPRVTRKFDRLYLQMFILTCSTKRDVARRHPILPPSGAMKFTCQPRSIEWSRRDPSRFFKKFRGFVVAPPRALTLPLSPPTLETWHSPFHHGRSRCADSFWSFFHQNSFPDVAGWACATFLLWSTHICVLKAWKYRRTVAMLK